MSLRIDSDPKGTDELNNPKVPRQLQQWEQTGSQNDPVKKKHGAGNADGDTSYTDGGTGMGIGGAETGGSNSV